MNKIKISQKEFDDIYDIEEITEEIGASPEPASMPSDIPDKQDTTPFLNQEETELEDKFLEDYKTPPEEEIQS